MIVLVVFIAFNLLPLSFAFAFFQQLYHPIFYHLCGINVVSPSLLWNLNYVLIIRNTLIGDSNHLSADLLIEEEVQSSP